MKEEKKHSFRKIFFIFLIILALFFLWARFINTKGLKIKEYGIINKDLPNSFHGLKIIHFSDIHYGQTTDINDIKKLVTEINELKPDIVFFTGDLINSNINPTDKEINNLKKELSKIETSLYKYAIYGDNDKKNDNYKQIMEDANFTILNNSNELLYYKSSTPIKIVGLTNLKDLENSFKEETLKESFTILLMHKPDQIDSLKEYRIDFSFAGHSLGGQIKIPFIGGIIKKNGSKKYIGDYYKVDNTELYISNGIGTDKLKFRTFNKPSINLYRIYSK